MIHRRHFDFYDRYHFKVITAPVGEHVSLDEARDHLRIVPWGSPAESDEDAWITSNISVAREWCEGYSMCALRVQTLELGIAYFPGTPMQVAYPSGYWWPFYDRGIMLPMASPFISIVSVKYDDPAGVEQTLDPTAYYVDDYARPAVLYPASGTAWPGVQFDNRRAVRVRYMCGYSLIGDSPMLTVALPFEFRAAMLLVLGHLHENRENTADILLQNIPLGAQALMSRYSCRLGMA